MDAASDVTRSDRFHRGGDRRPDVPSNGHNMHWMPPPHWFFAVFVALVVHVTIIGFTFYRSGWKRGLIAIPVSIVLWIVSIVGGVAADLAVTPLDPLPLWVVLGLGAYVLHAIMR